jgi:LPXTG-site transpeptidase (sortase) family protein
VNKFKVVLVGTLLLIAAFMFVPTIHADGNVAIRIPALGIESIIDEFPLNGTSWTINPWETGVGHLQGTGWFDSSGNIAIGGHSWMPNRTPGIFVNLHTLAAGDEIVVNVNGTDLRYAVSQVSNVSMYDLEVLYPTDVEQLTLITCDAGSFDPEHQLYQRRVIVQAQRIH